MLCLTAALALPFALAHFSVEFPLPKWGVASLEKSFILITNTTAMNLEK